MNFHLVLVGVFLVMFFGTVHSLNELRGEKEGEPRLPRRADQPPSPVDYYQEYSPYNNEQQQQEMETHPYDTPYNDNNQGMDDGIPSQYREHNLPIYYNDNDFSQEHQNTYAFPSGTYRLGNRVPRP